MSATYIKPAHGPRREITPQLLARCILRYSRGMSLDDIAIRENCSGPKIRRLLAEAGIAIRKRGIASDSWRYATIRKRPDIRGTA